MKTLGTTSAQARPLYAACLFLAVLFLGPARVPPAAANSWRTFGFGPRAVAMGGAFTAVADDFSAGYYNPSGILADPTAKFGLGYQYVRNDLKASGEEVESSRDADALYVGGSIVIPFTDELENRVAMGYYFFQPLFYTLDLQIPPTTQPQFPILESMARMQILHLVAAVKVHRGLLLGGGLTISSDLGGALNLTPGVGGFGGVEEVLSSVDQEVKPIVSGTAGFLLQLGEYNPALKPFTFGFTWRDKHLLDLDIPVTVVLSGFLLRLDLTSVFLYTPRQWVVGVGYRPSPNLIVSCDVSYNEWSRYQVPSLTIATDIDIPFVVLKEGVNEPAKFKDTATPRLGVEYRAFRWESLDLFLRGGYFFEPTPVPEQTTRTNYLDSNRHVFSGGIGFLLKRIFQQDLSSHPLSLDIGVSYHWLTDRVHQKRPETRPDNPGYPSITSSGNIWYFTVGLSYGLDPGTSLSPGP